LLLFSKRKKISQNTRSEEADLGEKERYVLVILSSVLHVNGDSRVVA
jgi:hypothetical protein